MPAKMDVQDLGLALLGGPGGWASVAGIMSKFIGTSKKNLNMQPDDDWKDNVKFIKNLLGDDVVISKDLPMFHSGCAFQIGDNKLLKDIDAAMKAAMMDSINKVTAKQKEQDNFISWKQLQEHFDSGLQFSPQPGKDVLKQDYLSDSGTSWFKFDGSASQEDITKVDTKMKNFVADPAIWNNMKIDKSVIAKMFGETGASVSGVAEFFAASSKRAHVAIDCGAVRFPSVEDPFFKIYRFRVIVTNSCDRVLCVQNDQKIVTMTLTTRNYLMNKEFTGKFTAEVSAKVDSKFDDMMAGLGIDL
jgi:hypothetical protein